METHSLKKRFRGFLPIIVDVETGGTNPQTDALLELAAISVKMDADGLIHPDKEFHFHIEAFEGTKLNPEALAFNKIDPSHPFRFAVSEKKALTELFAQIDAELTEKGCQRAVLVGHNAWFDQQFLLSAIKRNRFTKHPFHQFTSLDTATLGGLAFGQTVLAKALAAANIPFNTDEAHSALYDTQATAKLFCCIINQWKHLGGWPPQAK